MSCVGESDRNVENLFADLFDIRYLVTLSALFHAIYSSEDLTTPLRVSTGSPEKIVRSCILKLITRGIKKDKKDKAVSKYFPH